MSFTKTHIVVDVNSKIVLNSIWVLNTYTIFQQFPRFSNHSNIHNLNHNKPLIVLIVKSPFSVHDSHSSHHIHHLQVWDVKHPCRPREGRRGTNDPDLQPWKTLKRASIFWISSLFSKYYKLRLTLQVYSIGPPLWSRPVCICACKHRSDLLLLKSPTGR